MFSTRGSKTSLNSGRRLSIHALVSSSFSGGSCIDPSILMLTLDQPHGLALFQHHPTPRPAPMADSNCAQSASRASKTCLVRLGSRRAQ